VDDEELWKKINRQDERAFDAFYRQSAPRLQAFLRQIVGNREAAEDLTQESYLQLWRRPGSYRPERGSLRGYLYGVGRKRAAEWWRSKQPSAEAAEEPADAAGAESSSVMSDALQRLPEEQRSLLWLREVEGQSYAELAEILDIPIGTVRSRLFTAREALRQVWQAGARRSL
jgi:RNA polymerase sigma-70 factor (ECF subfamily)